MSAVLSRKVGWKTTAGRGKGESGREQNKDGKQEKASRNVKKRKSKARRCNKIITFALKLKASCELLSLFCVDCLLSIG